MKTKERTRTDVLSKKRKGSDTFVKAIVPDGGWGWIVCISCFVGNMAIGGIVLSYGIILPSIKEYFDKGTFEISLVGSLMTGFTYATAPVSAVLANRFGLRAAYMIGSLIAFVSFFSSAYSSNVYILMLFFGVIAGTGLGLVLMPVTVACNYYFEKRRALATGMAKTGFSVGGFVFPLVIYSVLQDFDWRGVVWVYGIMSFVSCIFASFVKPLELVISEENQMTAKDIEEIIARIRLSGIEEKRIVELNPNSRNPLPSVLITDTNTSKTSKLTIPNSLEPPDLSYSRAPRLKRRVSIFQLESMKQQMKKDNVKKTEFIFKPNAPEGSKLFLPPLARTDSFYDGSLANLFGPLSRENISPALDAHSGDNFSIVSMSVFDQPQKNDTFRNKFFKFSDISPWRNLPIFMLFLSRLFGNFSTTIFFMLLPSILTHNGFSLKEASIVLTVIGVSNTIPRTFMGTLMDHPHVNSCLLIGAGFFLKAIVICVLPFTFQYKYLLFYGVVIGISNSPYWVGLSIAIGRMVPMRKVASTCSLMSIAQGLGSIIGPPTAGFVFDITDSYSHVIYMIAVGYIISGFTCCAASYIYNRRNKWRKFIATSPILPS